MSDPEPIVETVAEGVARISWSTEVSGRGLRAAVGVVAPHVEAALEHHTRVETLVSPHDLDSQRIATWAGMLREGVRRGVSLDDTTGDRIVYARLVDDVPVSDPHGFRSLLNSFLPRKRAIGQLLVRDTTGRVLLCELTYKRDWDLPGGVVEVGESPQLAVGREVEEELGLPLPPGDLVLTDWLPAWGGWDDAVCLVFDGGSHEASLLDRIVRQEREIRAARFCTLEEIHTHCADFTARRIVAALDNLGGAAGVYTESGRRVTGRD